jgi:hypothetical protein
VNNKAILPKSCFIVADVNNKAILPKACFIVADVNNKAAFSITSSLACSAMYCNNGGDIYSNSSL